MFYVLCPKLLDFFKLSQRVRRQLVLHVLVPYVFVCFFLILSILLHPTFINPIIAYPHYFRVINEFRFPHLCLLPIPISPLLWPIGRHTTNFISALYLVWVTQYMKF